MTDTITMPRETVQKAYDALEAIEDCFTFNSPTWVLHQQIGVLLDPASAGLAAKPAAVEQKAQPPQRRDDWHYDSQGYCDNPGRGY